MSKTFRNWSDLKNVQKHVSNPSKKEIVNHSKLSHFVEISVCSERSLVFLSFGSVELYRLFWGGNDIGKRRQRQHLIRIYLYIHIKSMAFFLQIIIRLMCAFYWPIWMVDVPEPPGVIDHGSDELSSKVQWHSIMGPSMLFFQINSKFNSICSNSISLKRRNSTQNKAAFLQFFKWPCLNWLHFELSSENFTIFSLHSVFSSLPHLLITLNLII